MYRQKNCWRNYNFLNKNSWWRAKMIYLQEQMFQSNASCQKISEWEKSTFSLYRVRSPSCRAARAPSCRCRRFRSFYNCLLLLTNGDIGARFGPLTIACFCWLMVISEPRLHVAVELYNIGAADYMPWFVQRLCSHVRCHQSG